MTLEVSPNKKKHEKFLSQMAYFGIKIAAPNLKKKQYNDIERYFLSATLNMNSSRVAEGFLCWILEYGHLLSPSKIRRLIAAGVEYNSAVLGAFVGILVDKTRSGHQFKILEVYTKKLKVKTQLFKGPVIKKTNSYFLKYNLIAHNYKLDKSKFLFSAKEIYKNCLELKNRALFGSTVNADVASYLKWNSEATAYRVAKETFHHKASVFKVYEDVSEAG